MKLLTCISICSSVTHIRNGAPQFHLWEQTKITSPQTTPLFYHPWRFMHVFCLSIGGSMLWENPVSVLLLNLPPNDTRGLHCPTHLRNFPRRFGHHQIFQQRLPFWQGYNYANNSLISPFIYLTLCVLGPWRRRWCLNRNTKHCLNFMVT